VIPHSWTLPARSACCAWITATSGLSAATAVSVSPVNGQVIGRTDGWPSSPGRPSRPVPRYPRSTAKGTPEAPATYRLAMPAWLCSSSLSGPGQRFSTASRNLCSDPTPGFPPHEKISLLAHPAPMSWS